MVVICKLVSCTLLNSRSYYLFLLRERDVKVGAKGHERDRFVRRPSSELPWKNPTFLFLTCVIIGVGTSTSLNGSPFVKVRSLINDLIRLK